MCVSLISRIDVIQYVESEFGNSFIYVSVAKYVLGCIELFGSRMSLFIIIIIRRAHTSPSCHSTAVIILILVACSSSLTKTTCVIFTRNGELKRDNFSSYPEAKSLLTDWMSERMWNSRVGAKNPFEIDAKKEIYL